MTGHINFIGQFDLDFNRRPPFTTRWIREIVKKYARKAGIEKRIHPHLFRHQILTYLTSKGIVDAKIQLISGHIPLISMGEG